jgi:hypothetical protein
MLLRKSTHGRCARSHGDAELKEESFVATALITQERKKVTRTSLQYCFSSFSKLKGLGDAGRQVQRLGR